MADQFAQNAILSEGKCKQECKKSCHIVQTEMGLCILVTPASKTTFLPEELCIGFGICVKRYPFEAVQIIKPNIGRLTNPQNWQKYLTHYRGSELESYLTRVVEEILKPQHVDQIKKIVSMLDEREMLVQICAGLELDRRAKKVFGRELQRYAIGIGLIEKAETYMFDLDAKQILDVAQVIRSLLRPNSCLLKCGEVTTMSDLPDDLVEEILSRVPLTSVSSLRSTCRKWNDLSKNRVFGTLSAAGRKQFLGFMLKDYKVCSIKFDLQGIRNEGDFVDPSIKEVSILDQVEISQVFHCEGLLLCVTKDMSRLLVWNPYLGQINWIQPRVTLRSEDRYAIGYDKSRNYKILRIFGKYDTKGDFGSIDKHLVFGYEIYDLSSSSWKVFNVKLDRNIHSYQLGVSLKGHPYFTAQERWTIGRGDNKIDEIISFDFTTERFGMRLPLPIKTHDYVGQILTLSCVREEQLAVLHQNFLGDHTLEIWVSSKIDAVGAVSWSKFLRITSCHPVDFPAGSFFVDEEKKVAVLIDLDNGGQARTETCYNQRACIIGQDEYFKPVNVGEALDHGKCNKFGVMISDLCRPLVCSYVPSSVQLQVQPGKWKDGDD